MHDVLVGETALVARKELRDLGDVLPCRAVTSSGGTAEAAAVATVPAILELGAHAHELATNGSGALRVFVTATAAYAPDGATVRVARPVELDGSLALDGVGGRAQERGARQLEAVLQLPQLGARRAELDDGHRLAVAEEGLREDVLRPGAVAARRSQARPSDHARHSCRSHRRHR